MRGGDRWAKVRPCRHECLSRDGFSCSSSVSRDSRAGRAGRPSPPGRVGRARPGTRASRPRSRRRQPRTWGVPVVRLAMRRRPPPGAAPITIMPWRRRRPRPCSASSTGGRCSTSGGPGASCARAMTSSSRSRRSRSRSPGSTRFDCASTRPSDSPHSSNTWCRSERDASRRCPSPGTRGQRRRGASAGSTSRPRCRFRPEIHSTGKSWPIAGTANALRAIRRIS